MIRAIIFCLLLLPLQATAQSWPSLYKVTNVSGDDVLNVRTGPSADSEIVGALAPGEARIEVINISPDGQWAKVNLAESSGWASMQFLSKEQDFGWPPPSLSCFGTEPFWSASFIHSREGHLVTFQSMNTDEQEFKFPQVRRSLNKLNRYSETAWPLQSSDLFIATFSAQSCGDGMSDQMYGISVEVLLPTDRDWNHYSGCCSFSP